MIKVNDNFRDLPESYLFSKVREKVMQYSESHPAQSVIRMDIGDVTRPLFPCVIEAMSKAVKEMGDISNFRGYGPEQGYEFLREAISGVDYACRGIDIKADEIFVSDGAKSDLANLGDILSGECRVAIQNPAYPVYTDDNVIQGRAGKLTGNHYGNLISIDDRFPDFKSELPDVIVLCSPNNPTGDCFSTEELGAWVEYARKSGCLIIFDSAYEAYIRSAGKARSIYEIPGAKEVAIEVRSFSKSAGFTGVRCGYTVVPHDLKGRYSDGKEISLNKLWFRRQSTMFNGVSYVVQRGAEALYTPQGQECIKQATDYYLGNASIIRSQFEKTSLSVSGGVDSPYVWIGWSGDSSSWDIFDMILSQCGVSTTPGIGFGDRGEHHLRLTGFNSLENTIDAMERIANTELKFY